MAAVQAETVLPSRNDDSSIDAIIAFAKRFDMVPAWSCYPKGSDTQSVHAYWWPSMQQHVLFTRYGHQVAGVWRGGWEVFVQPTASLGIADTEMAMRSRKITIPILEFVAKISRFETTQDGSDSIDVVNALRDEAIALMRARS